jgi:hypothetical protein
VDPPFLHHYARRDGNSGLSLAAQRDAIDRFAQAEGFEIVGTFTEVETGKGADDGGADDGAARLSRWPSTASQR